MIRSLVAILVPFGAASLAFAADPPSVKVPKPICIQQSRDCATECLSCMKFCRENKMVETAKECEICNLACSMCAEAVESKNTRAWEICELCEKICNDCAAACEKGTHAEMKKCAEACRNCAKACADSRK
jgi:hypothetical protein